MPWRRRTLGIAFALSLASAWLLVGADPGATPARLGERDGVGAAARKVRASAAQGASHGQSGPAGAPSGRGLGSDPAAETRIERERLAQEHALHLSLEHKAQRTALETSLMRAIEQSSRYPTSNQLFPTEAHDPVVRERAAEKRQKRSADGRTLLTVWTDQKQYDPKSPVTVHALMGEPEPEHERTPAALEATLTAMLFAADGQKLVETTMRDEGGGRYHASFHAASGHRPLREGFYTGRITAEGLSQSFAFVVRPAYARLTGGYRDHLEGGHLIVEVEVDAFEDGDYYVFGSLYAEGEVPIGTAEVTQHLTAGASWVPLRFFGRLVHDGGRDGPFRLAHVSLAKKTFPISQGVEADPDHWTARYSLHELDPAPYHRLSAVDSGR